MTSHRSVGGISGELVNFKRLYYSAIVDGWLVLERSQFPPTEGAWMEESLQIQ